MVKYLVVHNKHEGCYDFQFYQDEAARIRLTSITINPPKIYMFNTRDEAQDFFEEYINDVDCIDIRCKRGDDVEHIDYCTCGVIELDEEENPILFYNRKNQIFLLEHGPQLFVPPSELKNDIKNLNLTNRLIRKCKSLSREQRNRYIELGKYCQDCNSESLEEDDDDDKNKVLKTETEIKNEVINNKDDEDISPELKVLKAIPPEGITLDALIAKVGDAVRYGMGICLKNKWIQKNGDLIVRVSTQLENSNNENNGKNEEMTDADTKEAKKPKTSRKKKTQDEEEKTESKSGSSNGTAEPAEKKSKAPRKKKTDKNS